MANDLIQLAQAKAKRYRIPPQALLALIEVESNFQPFRIRFQKNNPWVYSEKEFAKRNGITVETERVLQHFDWGLCQIPGSTARSLGYSGYLIRMLEPNRNLEYGAANLVKMIEEHGSVEGMAAAYGTGTSKKPYQNQAYVDRFLECLKKWEKDLCLPISGP